MGILRLSQFLCIPFKHLEKFCWSESQIGQHVILRLSQFLCIPFKHLEQFCWSESQIGRQGKLRLSQFRFRSETIVPLESVRRTRMYPMCVRSLRIGYESLSQ